MLDHWYTEFLPFKKLPVWFKILISSTFCASEPVLSGTIVLDHCLILILQEINKDSALHPMNSARHYFWVIHNFNNIFNKSLIERLKNFQFWLGINDFLSLFQLNLKWMTQSFFAETCNPILDLFTVFGSQNK